MWSIVYIPFFSYPKNTKISCEMGRGVCCLQAARIRAACRIQLSTYLWPGLYFCPWAAGQNTLFTIPSPGQLSNLPVTLPKILWGGGNYAVLQWRQCLNSPNASLGCCWSFSTNLNSSAYTQTSKRGKLPTVCPYSASNFCNVAWHLAI